MIKIYLKIYQGNYFNYKLYREKGRLFKSVDRSRLRLDNAISPTSTHVYTACLSESLSSLIDSFKIFNKEYAILTIDKLADSYIEELPVDNYLFDGALNILDYLNEKYQLHIITNGFEEVQYKKLKNSGILHYFSTVTTSEGLGLKKPNPLMFMAALDKANTSAIHSIMIGDSFEADILGAKNVGMDTIFYNYRNEKIPDEFKIINALSEIKSYL